jgi:hypothetical protein
MPESDDAPPSWGLHKCPRASPHRTTQVPVEKGDAIRARTSPRRSTLCRGLAVLSTSAARRCLTRFCLERAATCQPRGSNRESCERSRGPGLPVTRFRIALKGRNNRHGPVRRSLSDTRRNGARSMVYPGVVRHSFLPRMIPACAPVFIWLVICCALSGLCADSTIRNPGLRNRDWV